MKKKTPQESLTISTDLVLTGETNQMGTLFGGELLSRLDKVAFISACKHAGVTSVVTGAVNNVFFEKPIPLGSIVTLEAKVSRAFTSSMEVIIDVWIENVYKETKEMVNQAIYTFIALDESKKPFKIPEIEPVTKSEISRYNGALQRREIMNNLRKS